MKKAAVDDAKASVRQLELELDYTKPQLAKTEQEKKDAQKPCNTWKEMSMMTKARRMNAPAATRAWLVRGRIVEK